MADSGNNRLQLFTTEGEFIEQWTNLVHPASLFIGKDKLLYIGESQLTTTFDPYPARVSIYNLDGKRQVPENLYLNLWNIIPFSPSNL